MNDPIGARDELLPALPGARAEIVARLSPFAPSRERLLRLEVEPQSVHVFDAHKGLAVR